MYIHMYISLDVYTFLFCRTSFISSAVKLACLAKQAFSPDEKHESETRKHFEKAIDALSKML